LSLGSTSSDGELIGASCQGRDMIAPDGPRRKGPRLGRFAGTHPASCVKMARSEQRHHEIDDQKS
jgi:hypothetical protein